MIKAYVEKEESRGSKFGDFKVENQAFMPNVNLWLCKPEWLNVPFWEKNPALAARRFSIYNAMVCNTIEEQPIQSLTAPITSFG